MRTTTNHEFAFGIRYRATDQRIVHQNIQGSDDFAGALSRVFYFMAGHMIKDAIKIVRNLRRQLDAWHLQGVNLRATGRFVALPAMRASR